MSPSAKVENLTPPGAEPHDLELTPQAVARIETAAVVLYLSHGFQPAVSDAVKSAGGRRADILRPPDRSRAASAGARLHAASGQEAGLTVARPGALPADADLRALDRDYRKGLRSLRA